MKGSILPQRYSLVADEGVFFSIDEKNKVVDIERIAGPD